jgi:chitin disaccharide deacetylase
MTAPRPQGLRQGLRSDVSKMGKKRLIVSADDFGMSPGINAGIARAHRDGILTDASLMVNGAAFDEAVRLAKEMPSLSVGLHLVLVQGRASAPAAAIPALVDASGFFANAPIASGLRYFFQPGVRRQLETEIRAQLEKFRASGLELSHVDGHLNVHMHPAVLPILLDLAPAMDIGAVRLSREPLLAALRFDRRHLLRKSFEATVFHALSAHAIDKLDARSIGYPRRMYGLHQTGHVTEEYLLHVIARLPDGVSEIYCHAGVVDDEAARWRPADYRSDEELRALTSARVRESLRDNEVELTSYRHLGSGPGAAGQGL